MTKEQAIKESIEHWERMIAWVEGLKNKEAKPNGEFMKQQLGEYWWGIYCPLCQKYDDDNLDECIDCPLVEINESCDRADSTWGKVARSYTWGTWLKNAYKMLEVLRSL
jgi:hypothetical protein